ncbi:hypothetical protein EVAR_100041_1, partial [Eumeta japonica]
MCESARTNDLDLQYKNLSMSLIK